MCSFQARFRGLEASHFGYNVFLSYKSESSRNKLFLVKTSVAMTVLMLA